MRTASRRLLPGTAPRVLFAAASAAVVAGASAAAQQPPPPVTVASAAANPAAVTVSGTIYDSLAHGPLTGALVQLVAREGRGPAWNAETDVAGAFRLAAVPPGRYLIGFWHPRLDSMGLGAVPRTITVDSSAGAQVALAVPSTRTVRSALCPDEPAGDSTGLLVGYLRDADSGAQLGGAMIVLTWTELVEEHRTLRLRHRRVPARASGAGWYAVCGLPSSGTIGAHAELDGRSSGEIEIVVPASAVMHRDFRIGPAPAPASGADSLAPGVSGVRRPGTARLAGTVRDEHGAPLAAAQVIVWGTDASVSSRDDGTFAISGLPSGTRTIEVRYLGRLPRTQTVELSSDRTTSVAVTLDERADALRAVTVFGRRRTRVSILEGFLERRSRGFGHFITQEDIARRKPLEFTDLLRQIPGLQVTPTGGTAYAVVATSGSGVGGPCWPEVYLDGARLVDVHDLDLIVRPVDIAGIEFYRGIAETPAQFQGHGLCGSLVIWTRAPLSGSARR